MIFAHETVNAYKYRHGRTFCFLSVAGYLHLYCFEHISVTVLNFSVQTNRKKTNALNNFITFWGHSQDWMKFACAGKQLISLLFEQYSSTDFSRFEYPLFLFARNCKIHLLGQIGERRNF